MGSLSISQGTRRLFYTFMLVMYLLFLSTFAFSPLVIGVSLFLIGVWNNDDEPNGFFITKSTYEDKVNYEIHSFNLLLAFILSAIMFVVTFRIGLCHSLLFVIASSTYVWLNTSIQQGSISPRHWLNKDKAYCVELSQDDDLEQVRSWCHKNLNGRWSVSRTKIYLTKKTDVVLFKMFAGCFGED